MRPFRAILTSSVLVATSLSGLSAQQALQRDYPVKPVPFTAVHFNDTFWLPRIETNRKVTIPFAFQKCEETGRVYNFERAAAVLRGETVADKTPPGFPFDDTDIYKVIEGASYTLSVVPDPKLEAYVDGLVRKIGAAQEPDGYLYTTRTIDPVHPHPWAGAHRWENEEVLSHELYNLGHLYEAATAYYQATGKRQLLDIALRTANLLDSTFGPGKQAIWPGHQIAEMGLVKLYRTGGDTRYLNLAKFLLDSRRNGSPYNQSDIPIVQQKDADPLRFPDLSLAVIKLLGAGEYIAELPEENVPGHFGLAVNDYSHSTAPNRRYPDLVTQRLLKSAIAGNSIPYSTLQLEEIARHCTLKEDDVRKVERQVEKSANAILMKSRIGEVFEAIVSGASPKGTWIRIFHPHVEGKLVKGFEGLKVGQKVKARLTHINVESGFIDFESV